MRQYRDAVLGALVALGLLLPIWWQVSLWHKARLLTDRRAQVTDDLTHFGNSLTTVINGRLARLEGLRAFVQAELASSGQVREPQFATFSRGLYAGARGTRAFAVAPGGVNRYVYPLAGNENVPGHDLVHDERPDVRASVQRALQSREMVLSGPYELRQGGLGVVARVAIHRGDIFWGLASMVLDIPPVLDEAGITGDPRGLSLALRQASGQVFFGSAEVFKAEPVLYRISLPDGSWELGAVPARGWDASIQDALFLFRGAGLTIVALMAGLVSLVINRQGRLKVAVHQATVELERDIAERKRMEEALRISQARFAGIVEISEDAIISLDDFQRIILFNQGAARTFGYRAEEVLGQPVDLLIPARFVEAHRHHVEKFTSCRDALRPMNERGTIFGLRKDGTEFPAEASIAKFEVAGEKVLTVRLRDITERRRLEAQVRQAQKMEAIGSLAGGIAHDFNNILSAMLGYTEQAMLGVQLESRVWHDLHEVLVAGERARELVRHILTFSRQSEQERRPVHLHHIVAEALKLLRATLPATIEIRQELDPAPGAVLADPTQMHQVVMNLCTNAGHAMRESGGVLEVGVKAFPPGPRSPADHPELGPGPYLKLTVRDSGHGMEREILERIFDPFFTTKEPGEGTGMGLAVVHGIVASHGGVITVQSAPGEGTTFEVYLPQTADSIPAEVRPEEPVAERGARILFVDDEPALARLGAEMLEGAGHRVVATASSLEALKVFRAAPDSFDVVITDQTMPEMTGEALARELLSIRPDLPVIQCTGFSHTLSAEKARAMGIAEYILKPVGRRDLRAAVQRALRAKREQAQRDASGRPKAATPAGIPTEPEEAPGSAA